MSYPINDITAPLIQLDSVAIGFQLNNDGEASNINKLDLTSEEYLVVGEKTYYTDTSNTKWSLIVNSQGTSVNASRNLARNNLTHDTSLYVDKNIYCTGIIKAAGLELSNIRIDDANPITCNLIKEFIVKTNDLVVSQPFQTGYITNYSNLYDINYDVKNIFTPNYVTFGGHVDTYKNTHPLNIVSTPNNKFSSMHIAIRNDTNNSEEPSKMCMGIIGGSNTSPAIISTTKGVPLEFHVSRTSDDITMAYGTNALPTYSISNIPAMTIDAYNNVGIGTNNTTLKIYNKKSFINNITNTSELHVKSKFEVKGLSTFDDILLYDFITKTYRHLDDIYIRSSGVGVLNATQINGGDFTDPSYRFNNNLSVVNELTTKDIIINNDATIQSNLTTNFFNVLNHSRFDGTVAFNNNVDFDNVENINVNKLNITNDLFINNKRVTPLNLTDTFTGNYETVVNGSNYLFVYVSSNIASLDANCNVNFPNKLALGLTDSDGFDGILNIIKNDRSTSNNFDIFLKNKLENKEYIANIGRLSRLDYNDNSLIFNTNFVKGKKNNIYFYPSSDISILTSNRYLPNLKNTPPTLSLLDGKVGINKLIPDNLLSLDVNGAMAANDYYISQNNSFKRTKNFAYNNDKNFFNLYDTSTEKFCINYNELLSFASDMRGLNVKKGINADLYYQNNILLETLQKASSEDSFYTNKNISIGWNGEQNVAPLQVRNLFTNDYNYSTIRIYRGLRGGGLFNNADYSGIDICEYDRDIEQDRNKEKWFIYKNHKYNDLDARNYMRVGPLQIGYTDKTIEPTSYGMSFYYDTATSKYHIDVNNPKVSYEDKSAMTIYGDLNVHGNINILDNEGCNYNFTMKLLSSNLQRVDRYINYISNAGDSGEGYDKSGDKIEMSFDILRSRENLVIDPLKNSKTPVIIKNMNDDNPVTKFITYSKSNICYSMIELAIYNSNLQILDDSIDKNNNVKNAVQISLGGNNNSNTTLDFNVYNNDAYKNFLRFTSKVSDNGDANSTIAHFGLGTDKSSNILLHIDGNEKYGLQITNNQYPASINLLNSEGPNVYHNISGGEFHNNYKFNIGVSSSNNGLNEPILTNVFTIDAFKYDAEKRRGARFGFNEDFKSNTTQSFVLNTDYDTVAMGIRSRYSYEYMFNSTARINYDYVSIDPISSNWNNNNKVYYSLYKQNILELPPKDDSNNPIISSNVTDDFIFKTNNTISNKLSYITVHSNINYPYLFSNLNINLSLNIPLNVSSDILRDDFILRKEDTYNLLPNNIFYSSNDDIKPTDITQKSHTVNNTTLFNVDNSDILFNYTYINKYNLPKNISSNIDLINYSNFQSIGNSNYFNISNYIITTLSTQDIPFNQSQNSYEHVYIDFNQTKVNIKVAANIVNSNNYINTYTKNILKYNSNIFYDGVFFSAHKNELNIITSNIIFDNFFDKNTAYLKITSNIIDANNIIIRASNYSINNNVNSLPRNMIIKRLSSNIISDSFDILGNTINNNLIIEEYISDYSNVNIKNFSIGIRNYNYKNYKPHISLINDVERNNNLFEGHEIYSYDGIFEIKYSNSKNNQLVPLKIDKEGTMFLEGGLDMKGNLRFDGRIYDANGNDLIEILNKNYYKEYEINSSNIHFNALGSNGVEINSYATSNYSNYKFFYVKDMLAINSNIYTNEVTNIFNDILVLHKSELLYHKYNLDLYTDLYVHSNVYIEGYGNRTSFSVLQKENANIIEASNLNREVLTLAYDGSMGLGVTEPQSVLLNIKQHIIGSNVISASNFEREILTLAYDGSMGLGVTEPQSVLFNIKQNIIGSNVISASNLGREILTLAYDGSMGLGVTEPQSVLLNIKQNIIGSNVISASNLGREILTLAYDGSMGLGVTEPLGVLLNIKQNIIGSNVISASNLGREILTLAYDGSMGLGVTEPQGVLLNIKQNIIGSNVISASNLERETLTLAYDGSMGLGVTEPLGVLLNIKQNIIGSNVISASNLGREILTLAYDGSMGLGVTEPQSVLLNIKQNIIGSNVISASNLGREILTLAYDGSMGLGVTEPQSVLLNIKQNIIASNVISASNLGREILTLAYDGSMGLGVTEPLGVLLNIKQNIIGSNVISASNLGREILTLAYDGSMGLGVTEPQGVLLNIKQNIIGCNVISASNLERETLTLAYDGSMGLGVTEPLGVLLNIKQNIIGSNVISASNLGREILTLAYDGSMGLGVTEPQSVLLNIKQNIIGSNVISASNLEREILTLAYDGSMGMGVTEPLGVLLNIKQNIIGSNVISASNLNNEIMTLTYDGIMGIGVTNPNKQSKLDVRGNINIVNDTGIEYIYTIDNRDIIKDTSNYVLNTSNIISKRITDLTTDVITEKIDAVNKFIVNNKYDNNLYVNGNLTINSNLIVYGETTILNTDVYTTEQLIITNTGEGDAMIVKQINNSYNIFTASNNNIPVFNINCDGRIGVKTENPQVILEINSTDGIKIPTGTDIQRPVGIDMKGTIRYNTDTQQFEGYGAGDKWGILGGVKDINNDTYISAEVFPGSNNDELRFYTGNIEKMIIKQDGKVGIGTQNPKLFFEVNSSDGIKLPVGSDIQRPTGDNILGTIRYNTDTKQFEGYGSTNTWGSLGGLKDVNNDTFISTENSPGSNDDELRFYTSNIEKMIIKKDGRVGIGKDDPFYLLDVSGDIRTTSNLFVNLNVGIGTTNIAGSLLNIYGKSANVKIQNPDINNPISSIEFINGTGDSIDKNDFYGWKMLNSNNNFSIVSGSNSIVKDTLIIHGESGNIGVGTYPHTIMDSNTDIYKIHVNGSINIEGDIYRQGVLFLHETTASGTARNVGVISQHMPIQTQTKTYSITKSYLNSEVDNDDGWRFIDNNINNGFVIKIKPSHKTSKILINLSMHIGIDSSPESIWWGIRLYRKIIDNDQQIVSDWKEVVESRPKDDLDNNEEKATPCWISHSLGANLTSYENFVANVSGSFSDIPDARYTVYYTAKWKTNLGNSDSGNANIYLNRPAKYNSRNSSILSSSWTATEIWQLGTPYMPTEGSNVITIYDRDYVGIGNTQPQYILDVTGDIRTTSNLLVNLNVGIGTTDVSDSLLNIYGKSANIKIQDPDINDPVSSIEFINGVNNSIQSNISYGWKMFNSNNNYIISSGSNNIIKHRLIIDGESGNIGIGTDPHIIRDSNDDFYKMNINGSINVEGDIYRQGVLLSQIIGASGTSSSVGIISQNMPVQTLSKTYSNTKSYLDSEIDNDNGWRFVDDNINNGFLIKIKPSHRTSKILINLSMHIGIDSSPDSIWWGARLYRKIVDNNQNIMQDWHEVIASRPVENSIDNATPCWLSHTLGANLTSYENFVANINGTFFDRPDTVYTTYYTIKWKTDLGNNYGESANIYLNRPAKYNSSNSPVLSSTWTVTEIWQLGTPYMPTEGSNVITIYNQDYVGIGNTEPLYSLDVSGDIRASSNLIVNLNVGIGTTSVSDSLLNIYGKRANIKIQDPDINEPISSIEFINGINNSIDSNNYYGWKMYNSNNNYTISSGNNGAIHDRFIIEGSSGNIGVGTIPNHKLDINGIINAKAFNINGSPFVLEFTQGMTIQTIHKTYSKTLEKQSNSIGWIPIDNGNDGFLVKIKPSHIKSKVLVSMTCHIGMDYSEDSRWWGLQLYRKIGDSGEWSPLNNANGTNSGGLECSPCWISHNLGADNSMYSHSIINVSGSYEDEPNTTSNIYYTAYWKSKLDNTEGKLYINRPAYINSSNYPLTSSSWTASEIWNNGTPYKPTTTTIAIAYDKVGIGMTPSISSGYKLEVNGDFKCRDIQCLSVTQTSDSRYKKNIEGIDSVLENINKLNPISYLTLDQNNTDKKSYGFIAQEINELFPDIVNEPKNINELYAINYTSIIPLLTKSIQELTKKIEMQQQEINYLKQKL